MVGIRWSITSKAKKEQKLTEVFAKNRSPREALQMARAMLRKKQAPDAYIETIGKVTPQEAGAVLAIMGVEPRPITREELARYVGVKIITKRTNAGRPDDARRYSVIRPFAAMHSHMGLRLRRIKSTVDL